jgi:hypothetical protein
VSCCSDYLTLHFIKAEPLFMKFPPHLTRFDPAFIEAPVNFIKLRANSGELLSAADIFWITPMDRHILPAPSPSLLSPLSSPLIEA